MRVDHLVLTIPTLPPGMNGNNGMDRMHYRAKQRWRQKLRDDILISLHDTFGFNAFRVKIDPKKEAGDWDQTCNIRMATPCREVYTRRYCGTSMDWVNAAASLKLLEDMVVRLGVIPDDTIEHILGFTPLQERVETKKEEGCTLEFVT